MADTPVITATYRWQLTTARGFDAAAATVPDLAALGVSHLYLSPIAEAVPGSEHGYDVVDPTRVRAELGGEQGLEALAATCSRHGMHLVVDIVPNHLAAHPANPWWWDVLRLGRRSRWAPAFDVDWRPPKRELAERVLMPILGDHYGRELEAGAIVVTAGESPARLLVVRYHEHELPLSPATTAEVLAAAATEAGDDVLGVAARVLARAEAEADLDARDADIAVAERTAVARLADAATASALTGAVAALNADADRLDDLLERQHHRLAYWRIGAAELDYRRFFDIDTLVATRVDRPAVHAAVHRLPSRLVHDGLVAALRVDHIDGLRDPATYLERLAEEPGCPVWVEKILRSGEDLPAAWPIAGTTGYEVADLLGAWLTDPAGAGDLLAGWRERVGEKRSFAEVVLECRRLVLETSLGADVERLTEVLVQVCEGRRRHRDHARVALRRALVEVAAHAPAYRSYVRFRDDDPQQPEVTAGDRALIEAAVANAAGGAPDVDPELLSLIGDVLAGRLRGPVEAEVALRFQQLTGPVAAKGEEDTALYRWLPVPHRCEVGADPARLSATTDDWHESCRHAQFRWPGRLTALTTHDTKRSADVRARLAVLTTVPSQMLAAYDRWCDAWSGAVERPDLVDPASAWTAFQALAGAHPLPVERAWPAIQKSLREAKVATTWLDPDEAFEAAVASVVRGSCEDPEVSAPIAGLVASVDGAGRAAALAQLALQLLAPGVPDVYQGGEGWDLSLVDPDNRRGRPAEERHDLVVAAGATNLATAWADQADRDRGLPRAIVLRAALDLRRRHASAVGPDPAGCYHALAATGPDTERVIAFARGKAPRLAVAAARPGPGAAVTCDATVELPAGRWVEHLHGGHHAEALDLGALPVPVALLERAEG